MSMFSFDLLNQNVLFSWTEPKHCVSSLFNMKLFWPIVPHGNLSSAPQFPGFHTGSASWQSLSHCTTACDSNDEPYGLDRGELRVHNGTETSAKRLCIFPWKAFDTIPSPLSSKAGLLERLEKGGGVGLQVCCWKSCVHEKTWNSKS